MPQHQQTKDGGVIIWDQNDWLQGLASGYGTASTINYQKLGKGSEWLHAINPYLNSLGVLQPGLLGTALTENASIAATLSAVCVERTGTAATYWLLEAGANIHQIAIASPYTISGTSPFPYAITHHSGIVGEDIITFNINGTENVYYSFNDGTDGDIGKAVITGTFDDDWFSTSGGLAVALNKSVPHPMIVGEDQKLYIADLTTSGTLAKIWQINDSGVVAKFETIVPRNYVIRAFAKTGEHLVIFANKIKASVTAINQRGDAIAIFWDMSSSQYDYKYDLNDNEVTAGFYFKGVIGCFTTGRINEFANIGYRSKLQIFEGGRFIPIFNFAEESPKYSGLDIVNNMLIWNSGGVVYSYGSPYPDYPNVVNKITQCAGTTNGFLKTLNGLEIYASTGATTSNEVFKQSDTFYDTSAWRGLTAEPLFPTHKQGRVDYWEVGFFGNATGGRTCTVQLDFDYGATTKTLLNAVSTITTGTQIRRGSKDTSSASFPRFSAIKPKVSWAAGSGSSAAPKIAFIKIYYQNEEIKT